MKITRKKLKNVTICSELSFIQGAIKSKKLKNATICNDLTFIRGANSKEMAALRFKYAAQNVPLNITWSKIRITNLA